MPIDYQSFSVFTKTDYYFISKGIKDKKKKSAVDGWNRYFQACALSTYTNPYPYFSAVEEDPR